MVQPQPDHVDVPVYLLVEPVWRDAHFWRDEKGRAHLDGAKVVKATQGRPTVGRRGGVITKITLRIPAGAFLPLEPHAVVHVGLDDLETVVIEADAPEPAPEVVE